MSILLQISISLVYWSSPVETANALVLWCTWFKIRRLVKSFFPDGNNLLSPLNNPAVFWSLIFTMSSYWWLIAITNIGCDFVLRWFCWSRFDTGCSARWYARSKMRQPVQLWRSWSNSLGGLCGDLRWLDPRGKTYKLDRRCKEYLKCFWQSAFEVS